MRNLFDQYHQPENRLSHALAVCLHEDRTLLRGWFSTVKLCPEIGPCNGIDTPICQDQH